MKLLLFIYLSNNNIISMENIIKYIIIPYLEIKNKIIIRQINKNICNNLLLYFLDYNWFNYDLYLYTKNYKKYPNYQFIKLIEENKYLKSLDNEIWSFVFCNIELNENFIIKYLNILKYNNFFKDLLNDIIYYQKLSEKFIIDHFDLIINYDLLGELIEYQKLSENFIEKYINFNTINMLNKILIWQQVSTNFLNKYINNFNKECWNNIWEYQKVSEDFIEKYKNTISDDKWYYIWNNNKFSESFIENNIEFIKNKNTIHKSNYWYYILINNDLSDTFLEKYYDSFNLSNYQINYIILTKKVSDYFIINYITKNIINDINKKTKNLNNNIKSIIFDKIKNNLI